MIGDPANVFGPSRITPRMPVGRKYGSHIKTNTLCSRYGVRRSERGFRSRAGGEVVGRHLRSWGNFPSGSARVISFKRRRLKAAAVPFSAPHPLPTHRYRSDACRLHRRQHTNIRVHVLVTWRSCRVHFHGRYRGVVALTQAADTPASLSCQPQPSLSRQRGGAA
jgi:hypothetical protein